MKHLLIAFCSTVILMIVVSLAHWAGVFINRCEAPPDAERALGLILVLGVFALTSYASEEIAS